MEEADTKFTVEFPSVDAAWYFSTYANKAGWRTYFEDADIARISSPGPLAAIVLGPILGGSILGLVGWLSEAGTISLPRLEPLFASSYGALTMFFAALGVSLGLLVTFFAVVKPVPSRKHVRTTQVIASGKNDSEKLQSLAERYGGRLVGGARRLEGPTDSIKHLDEDPQE
jgi:hypothetical protein